MPLTDDDRRRGGLTRAKQLTKKERSKGGKARAKRMTKKERSEAGRKGGKTTWARIRGQTAVHAWAMLDANGGFVGITPMPQITEAKPPLIVPCTIYYDPPR